MSIEKTTVGEADPYDMEGVVHVRFGHPNMEAPDPLGPTPASPHARPKTDRHYALVPPGASTSVSTNTADSETPDSYSGPS